MSGRYLIRSKFKKSAAGFALTVFLATFERNDGVNLGNAKVATVLILHVNLLDAVLKGHSVLNFWVILEAEGRSVIHFAINFKIQIINRRI